MPYVNRVSGKIVEMFNRQQFLGQEFLEPNDDELLYNDKKKQLISQLSEKFASVDSSITISGDTFSPMPGSLTLMNASIISANYSLALTVDLLLSDGSFKTYSIVDANSILSDIVTYLNASTTNYVSLLNDINNAVDLDALNAIDINSGWPI